MNIRRTLIATVATAGLVTAGLGLSATNFAPAPAASAAEIPAEVTIDPLAMGMAISEAVKSADNREGFVKDVTYQAYYNAGQQQYNVIVQNLSQDHEFQLNGVAGYISANYDGVQYGVWLFDSGTFTNKGDGGYINWSGYGYLNRVSDDTIEFFTRG